MVIETKTDLQTAILENLKTGKDNALTGKLMVLATCRVRVL